MGWAGGSEVATEIWKVIFKYIAIPDLPSVAYELTNTFENADCDTMEECEFVRQYLKWNHASDHWEIK